VNCETKSSDVIALLNIGASMMNINIIQFKHLNVMNSSQELLFFLTPRILPG
jgi:hypothetical protein